MVRLDGNSRAAMPRYLVEDRIQAVRPGQPEHDRPRRPCLRTRLRW